MRRKTLRLGKSLSPEDIERSILEGFDECVGDFEGISKNQSKKRGKSKITHNGESK
ncbi:hypothetical protein [Thermococcus sp. M36]|uniref:hypothetical protein n=1 Tax=Thermococcus sp. M36 TaxID=1638261 RepID=UPI00143A4B44|nr:hypothetical protein [Thermococcus sp. M36]